MVLEEFDQQTAKLLPGLVMMESKLDLSLYSISDWNLVYYDDG